MFTLDNDKEKKMVLVDRHDEKVVYSNNGNFLTEYILVGGTEGVGTNANCVSYDYIFIVDKRYHRVVGMIENAKHVDFEMKLTLIKKQIEAYESEMLVENKGEFEIETILAEF